MDGLEAIETGLSHGRDRAHVCVSPSHRATMIWAQGSTLILVASYKGPSPKVIVISHSDES